MGFIPLVEEYRGGVLENVHYGAVTIVDEKGRLLYSAGDPEHMTFLRSAAKPFQAIPAMKRRIDEAYGLTGRETALLAASHRGEAFHIDALESMMHKIGIDEEALHCCATYPLNEDAKAQRYWAHEAKRRIFHNCSGKHTGMIALCKHMGWDEHTYYDPEHPVQKEIVQTLAYIAEVPEASIPQGVDGCGLPIFALPLSRIAYAFLKLACPDLIADADTRDAAGRIARLMNEYPDMIADTRFVCSELLKDANLAAKGGAKGVYGIGLRQERIGISLKVSDGSEQVWPCIIASILERLGYGNEETIDRLYKLVPNTIVNDGGTEVGFRRAVFDLKA
ncbi:asparaginase [Paenibacillus doosanensis]|uniref:L-asparaginase II n=1 Tax=Paenibacillus konkukensis TaxID=2020716 RepID=A0ABY4RUR4_9BACL|nr:MULTISPECIES: asparaginase [Paenibacillus]MCS7464277.1 asparaginase [Paenibacillus doosanensis]UQZ85474.1 L-asparaginase II [Paenibacillus konkukensis]